MPISALLSALGGGASGLLGTWMQGNALGNQQDSLKQIMNALFEQGAQGVTRGEGNYETALQALLPILQNSGMSFQDSELWNAIKEAQGQVPGQFGNKGIDPTVQYQVDRQGDTAQGFTNPIDVFQQLVSHRGTTGDTRNLFEQSMRPTDGMANILGLLKTLSDTGGRNSVTETFGDRSKEVANAWGRNPSIDRGLGIAESIASRGGADGSPEMGLLSHLLQSGGNSPLTTALAGKGFDLTAEPALLPTGDVVNMMTDKAVRNVEAAGKRALEQAINRGGQAGATVFGGGVNRALAEFAPEAAAAESDALREALMGQQGLKLNQQGQGLGALSSAADAASERLGLGVQGISSLKGIEANKLSQALGAISDLNRTATGNVGTYGQLGLGGERIATDNMGLAGQFANIFSNDQSANRQSALGTLGLENNRLMQGSGQLSSGMNSQSAIYDSIVRAILGNQNLNLDVARGQSDATNNLFSQQGKSVGQMDTNYSNALSQLLGMGESRLTFGGNMYNQGASAGAGQQFGSPMGAALTKGGFGTLIGALQDWGAKKNAGSTDPFAGWTGGNG